jgi:hypothetical protein
MKRILFLMAAFILTAGYCSAQTGNNQISVGAEGDFFISNLNSAYGVGFGGNVKGMFGVGTAGQVTLTAGYSSFGGKSGTVFSNQTFSMIPILAGYRQNFKGGLYLEPQAGVTINTTHFNGGTFSETEFGAGLNVGYATNGFDVSARYFSEGDVFGMFAVRVAYNFSLGK